MTKRRLNLRQRQRIKDNQELCLEPNASAASEGGLVLCAYGSRAEIETIAGRRIECVIRPNLPQIVAGDSVIWQISHEGGVIVSTHPRASVLERLDSQGNPKPLAANLSQLMIVMAAEPVISWTLIDSYLVTAEKLHLPVCMVLNKIDLPSQSSLDILNTYYAPLGYPVVGITKTDLVSYRPLEALLQDQVSIFIGQSGVGKSSLIKALLPDVSNIQTSPISETSGLGRHTTSHTRYYHLPQGGAILDSPGVRSFTPAFLGKNSLIFGYREFLPFLNHCKFRNCDHIQNLGCAIVQAVKQEKISAFRYDNFAKLILSWGK